jgi:hypothetical protein
VCDLYLVRHMQEKPSVQLEEDVSRLVRNVSDQISTSLPAALHSVATCTSASSGTTIIDHRAVQLRNLAQCPPSPSGPLGCWSCRQHAMMRGRDPTAGQPNDALPSPTPSRSWCQQVPDWCLSFALQRRCMSDESVAR